MQFIVYIMMRYSHVPIKRIDTLKFLHFPQTDTLIRNMRVGQFYITILFQYKQANDLSVIKDALAFKLHIFQNKLAILEITQDTAYPWGGTGGLRTQMGPQNKKCSPDVIFGRHDQPTLKL